MAVKDNGVCVTDLYSSYRGAVGSAGNSSVAEAVTAPTVAGAVFEAMRTAGFASAASGHGGCRHGERFPRCIEIVMVRLCPVAVGLTESLCDEKT
jgi:hypothetical protein